MPDSSQPSSPTFQKILAQTYSRLLGDYCPSSDVLKKFFKIESSVNFIKNNQLRTPSNESRAPTTTIYVQDIECTDASPPALQPLFEKEPRILSPCSILKERYSSGLLPIHMSAIKHYTAGCYMHFWEEALNGTKSDVIIINNDNLFPEFADPDEESFPDLRLRDLDEAVVILNQIQTLSQRGQVSTKASTTYSGVELDHHTFKVLKKINVGGIFTDPCHLSTSRDANIAHKFTSDKDRLILEIHGWSGADVASYSSNTDEKEVLYGRNVPFMVTKKVRISNFNKQPGDALIISLTQINPTCAIKSDNA